MGLSLDDITAVRGRGAGELTRRDVALALLARPAEEALAALADLRQDLTRAGNAFSVAFWESCERTLGRIASGEATFGEVNDWLESTGTHPTRMIDMLVWDDDGERGPVADEVHAALVTHLEQLVADGRINPDRLVAGDPEERDAYVEAQRAWLFAEDEQGQAPAWRVMDEEDAELEAAWAEVDRAALVELERVLTEVGERPCPTDDLAAAVARLQQQVIGEPGVGALLVASAWLDPEAPPADDTERWLAYAQGTCAPAGEPPEDADPEAVAAWASLEHADWLAAMAGLARGGPGSSADPDDLAAEVRESPDVGGEFEDPDQELFVAAGLATPVRLWRELGAVDASDRLTPLGWWGLPEALRRVWDSRS